MTDDGIRSDENTSLTDRLVRVAERKGQKLGLSRTEYLAGIMEERFPRITRDELDEVEDEAPSAVSY